MSNVQMLPFSKRSSVAEAIDWTDKALPDLGCENIASMQADGRVLTQSITSTVNVPGFHRGMMDGFAVRAIDVKESSETQPIVLRIVGDIYPGQSPVAALSSGETIRITTGAPVPPGADTVIPIEMVGVRDNTILVHQSVVTGKHVGPPGEDVARGQCVLEAGRRIRPQDVGLLSSIGINSVSVVRKPKVHLITTGNELLPAGTPPSDYRITDANSPMLESLVLRDGGEVSFSGIVPDKPDCILDAFKVDADILIVSGGTSVGCEDFVPYLLAQNGELGIHGVRMRPGSPIGIGTFENRPTFLLPGNPVACLYGYDFFAGRVIRKLTGRGIDLPYHQHQLPLGEALNSIEGRTDFVRVRIVGDSVIKSKQQGSSMLFSAVRSDGFIIIPEGAKSLSAGETVTVYCY
ncbi:MAG: gephyrin-like molybdotransferase Glp [Planctomycetota bacterium]|nr:gephyrin-like molybdotransferase Glp [Planctomycetota bacterium]